MDSMFASMVIIRVAMAGLVCIEFANSGIALSGRIRIGKGSTIASPSCAVGISSHSC